MIKLLTTDQEIRAFRILFDHLTNSEITDPYLMDHKFPVKLTPHQAAELIYIIEEKLKLGQNDVRMELCSRCEMLIDTESYGTCDLCDQCYCDDHNCLNICKNCEKFICEKCDPGFCDNCNKCSECCDCQETFDEDD